jgi:uncharacterized protein
MLSRRQMLKGFVALTAGVGSFGGYALAEPFRLGVTRYRLSPPGWPAGLNLRLAILADLHACKPWMTAERIQQIVARTNAVAPDATLLLGDFVVGHRLARWGWTVPHDEWAGALAELRAPLGVHAVLGNHDWWEDREVQERRAGPVKAGLALEAHGIGVYQNDAIRLEKDGHGFWLAGLGDQWAFWPKPDDYDEFKGRGRMNYTGVDDLPATLAQVTDDAPVVLMVHEPDIFPKVPSRVALTVAGHTHGGQVRLGDYAPVVPSKYGSRYVYGHIIEEDRNLIVSAGLGCSGLPVRFGAPPEIVLIELSAENNVA